MTDYNPTHTTVTPPAYDLTCGCGWSGKLFFDQDPDACDRCPDCNGKVHRENVTSHKGMITRHPQAARLLEEAK